MNTPNYLTHTPTNTKIHATFGLLISLYLAQGLPLGFITQALPAILREYEVSLQTIGWTGILLAPWALKFLWAPAVDKFYNQKIGQSRSWILPMQLLSALLLCVIAFMSPTDLVKPETMRILFLVLFFLNLCGANHDIASDAFSTRTLENASYSTGSSAQVIGYRMGLIFGGGVFLMIMDFLSWQTSFLLLAGFILLNTIPILLHKEPNWQAPHNAINNVDHSNDKGDTVIASDTNFPVYIEEHLHEQNTKGNTGFAWLKEQFGYFWHNKEMRAWLLVICTFKIADGLSSGMVKPMMTDMGITLKEIGLWGSVLGSAAALVGAGLAAILMKHMSRPAALIGFNFLQAITTGFYAVCAFYFEQSQQGAKTQIDVQLPNWVIYFANGIEHMAAAMALVAMLSTVMYYARKKQAGSDFTFQVCMLAFFSGNGHIFSGYIAEGVGYTGLFIISMLVGLLLLTPLFYWRSLFIKQFTEKYKIT